VIRGMIEQWCREFGRNGVQASERAGARIEENRGKGITKIEIYTLRLVHNVKKKSLVFVLYLEAYLGLDLPYLGRGFEDRVGFDGYSHLLHETLEEKISYKNRTHPTHGRALDFGRVHIETGRGLGDDRVEMCKYKASRW